MSEIVGKILYLMGLLWLLSLVLSVLWKSILLFLLSAGIVILFFALRYFFLRCKNCGEGVAPLNPLKQENWRCPHCGASFSFTKK